MPRRIRATAKQVQRSRRDWYVWHYGQRELAKKLPVSTLHTYLSALGYTTPPRMTVFGGLEADFPDRRAYEIAAVWGLDIHLINPWYLTNEGWEQFQALWQQLPEPFDIYLDSVHTPCVQVGDLYTIVHMPALSKPPK